jgi:hypothetical protein
MLDSARWRLNSGCHSANPVLITLASAETRLLRPEDRAAVAVKSVDLQNASVARQVPVWMLRAVVRRIEQLLNDLGEDGNRVSSPCSCTAD